jgi:outer membrane protein TolC
MLTGCLLTADALDPALDLPTGYRASHGSAKAELPSVEWWRGFRSAELTDLMEQALVANYDIAAAVARIVQADAQVRVTGASLLPSLDASSSATRSRNGGGGGSAFTESSVHSIALNASYVVDFWGRNRDLLRSAEFAASASRFDRELIALTTMVSVADTYFLVLGAQDRIRVNTQNVESSERILKLIQDRFNSGTALRSMSRSRRASLRSSARLCRRWSDSATRTARRSRSSSRARPST